MSGHRPCGGQRKMYTTCTSSWNSVLFLPLSLWQPAAQLGIPLAIMLFCPFKCSGLKPDSCIDRSAIFDRLASLFLQVRVSSAWTTTDAVNQTLDCTATCRYTTQLYMTAGGHHCWHWQTTRTITITYFYTNDFPMMPHRFIYSHNIYCINRRSAPTMPTSVWHNTCQHSWPSARDLRVVIDKCINDVWSRHWRLSCCLSALSTTYDCAFVVTCQLMAWRH